MIQNGFFYDAHVTSRRRHAQKLLSHTFYKTFRATESVSKSSLATCTLSIHYLSYDCTYVRMIVLNAHALNTGTMHD